MPCKGKIFTRRSRRGALEWQHQRVRIPGNSGRNTKKKTAMEQEVGRFQTEIILFVILAACVILMASNFGAGGFCRRCDQ